EVEHSAECNCTQSGTEERAGHRGTMSCKGRTILGKQPGLGGFGGMVLVDTVRWASRGKDAGSLDSGASIGATEDAVSRRPARRGGTVSLSPSPPTRPR